MSIDLPEEKQVCSEGQTLSPSVATGILWSLITRFPKAGTEPGTRKYCERGTLLIVRRRSALIRGRGACVVEFFKRSRKPFFT